MERDGDRGLMTERKAGEESRSIGNDAAMIAEIVQQVILRLGHKTESDHTHGISTTRKPDTRTTAAINERIITSQTIASLHDSTVQILIPPEAVITPAARDEARGRNVEIQRTIQLPTGQQPDQDRIEIIDHENPQRARAVSQQLAIRGITPGAMKIVLSDTPAKEVHCQYSEHNETAVMIGSINDIKRFSKEVTPTVWVLDMHRLTFTAAVNTIAQISKTGSATR